jgi:hypothetical protein
VVCLLWLCLGGLDSWDEICQCTGPVPAHLQFSSLIYSLWGCEVDALSVLQDFLVVCSLRLRDYHAIRVVLTVMMK